MWNNAEELLTTVRVQVWKKLVLIHCQITTAHKTLNKRGVEVWLCGGVTATSYRWLPDLHVVLKQCITLWVYNWVFKHMILYITCWVCKFEVNKSDSQIQVKWSNSWVYKVKRWNDRIEINECDLLIYFQYQVFLLCNILDTVAA